MAEHLYSQVNSEGNQYRVYQDIISHRRKASAIHKADAFCKSSKQKVQKKTTTGWDLEVEFKDGSTSWITLKEIKETNPVEVAEYAQDNNIIEEPTFAWWAPEVLKKRERLIKVVKHRTRRVGYKFGIKIPTSIDEALQLDK